MQVEGIKQTTDEIEVLRLLLEKQGRIVSYDEALEIGESLVSYFKTLASQEPSDIEEV